MSGQKLVAWHTEGVEKVLNNLAYGECRPNQSGLGKSCAMNFIDNGTPTKLVVQTPKMFAPFGVKEWEGQAIDRVSGSGSELQGHLANDG